MKLRNSFAIVFVVLGCLLTNTTSQYRIQGGSDWNIEKSPYVVSIHDDYRGYRCTGALISMQRVLTVAHCVKNLNKGDITVAAGVSDLRDLPKNGQIRKARDVHIPRNYNRETFDMDIAVIVVCEPFSRIPNKIDEIKLCCTPLNPDTEMRVSAWGTRTLGIRQASSILQSAIFYVMPEDTCADSYEDAGLYVPETKICAVAIEADTCNGDSGGPAVVDGRLCAMVSSMLLWAPNIPTLFTNINNVKVRTFIDNLARN